MSNNINKPSVDIPATSPGYVTALDLLTTLRHLGVRIRIAEGKIEYRASEGTVTGDMHLALERHREEIISILSSTSSQSLSLSSITANGSIPGPVPLSHEQARVWFLEQLDTAPAVHNLVTAVILEGELNIKALYQSFDTIVLRHEILRTTYDIVAGVPVQTVRVARRVARVVVDMSGLTVSLQQRECAHLSRNMQDSSFDLANDLMLRVVIARYTEDHHALFVSRHHIASDGWSFAILIRELNFLYARYRNKNAPELSPLEAQYTHYAEWQRQFRIRQAEIKYWKEQLHNAPACFRMPAEIPYTKRAQKKRSSFTFTLDAELVKELHHFSTMHSMTRFAVSLAAFQAAISWRTSVTDVIVGTDISTRDAPELEALIGLFVNRLVVRNKINPQSAFIDFALQVHRGLVAAYDHRRLPFDRIVEVVNPRRVHDMTPFFSIMFGFHNNQHEKIVLPDIRHVSLIEAPNVASQMDLSVYLTDLDGILAGEVIYDATRFRERSIRALIEAFSKLLEFGLAEPAVTLEKHYAKINKQSELKESHARSAFRQALHTAGVHEMAGKLK